MSHNKEDKSLTPKDSRSPFKFLSRDSAGNMAQHLSIKDLLNLKYASITTYNLFKPSFNSHLWDLARVCVVQRDVDELILIAQHYPAALFQKGEVIDPDERHFFNTSAYQLIIFLRDKEMRNQIMPFIPEELRSLCKTQNATMNDGGHDLVKLDRDPLLVAAQDFKGITEFKTTYKLSDGTNQEIRYHLLQNYDGIIYYKDDKQKVHFYYVNRDAQKIKKLHISISSEEEAHEWEQFKASLDLMENNSGRRSSNKEHLLIKKILGCTLQRKGILWEQNGIYYLDNCTPFGLINAYRTCLRLYEEGDKMRQWDKANTYWREGVGKAQREVVWLLQHKFLENKEIRFYNDALKKYECALIDGKFTNSLGSSLAFCQRYDGRMNEIIGMRDWVEGALCWILIPDALIDKYRFIEDAVTNIFEFEHILDYSSMNPLSKGV